jgi:hypothetical protein
MSKELHPHESVEKLESQDSLNPDNGLQSEVILKILTDAEPEGVGKDELRRLANEQGIDEIELSEILRPLMHYANVYFNANKGKYHCMWSSPIQYE